MLSRRAELRLHDRLHERLLDAQGRPRRRVRLPPARTHGRDGDTQCRAGRRRPGVERRPLLDFQAGYVQRSIHVFPKGGSSAPWKLGMSYAQDVVTLRHRSTGRWSVALLLSGDYPRRPDGCHVAGEHGSSPPELAADLRLPHRGVDPGVSAHAPVDDPGHLVGGDAHGDGRRHRLWLAVADRQPVGLPRRRRPAAAVRLHARVGVRGAARPVQRDTAPALARARRRRRGRRVGGRRVAFELRPDPGRRLDHLPGRAGRRARGPAPSWAEPHTTRDRDLGIGGRGPGRDLALLRTAASAHGEDGIRTADRRTRSRSFSTTKAGCRRACGPSARAASKSVARTTAHSRDQRSSAASRCRCA